MLFLSENNCGFHNVHGTCMYIIAILNEKQVVDCHNVHDQ